MKLVECFANFGSKVHELAWNLHEIELHFCEVILPKEYVKFDLCMQNLWGFQVYW